MAGKHRGPSIKHKALTTRLVRVNTTGQMIQIVEILAEREQRSVGNMITVLVTEALQARGLLKKARGLRKKKEE